MAAPITPTMTSTTTTAYHVQSFNGHEHLMTIHQGLSNFLDYQTNVQLKCTNQAACDEIIRRLKEESHHPQTIHQLIDSVKQVNNDLQAYYEGHERENSGGDNWQ